MKFTRRNFIKTSGLTAIGLVGLASSPDQIFGANNSRAFETEPLYQISAERFNQLIGTDFTIYGENFAISAPLQSVKEFSPKNKKAAVHKNNFGKSNAECFSLIFLLSSANLKQDVYSLFHPTIGQFNLLLVPSENEKGEPAFTAVINRI